VLKRINDPPIPDTIETSPLPPLKFPVALNHRWQIVDDALQFILQRRKGSKWINHSYCRTRDGLLRCVDEHAGVVCAEALAWVEALPDFHD